MPGRRPTKWGLANCIKSIKTVPKASKNSQFQGRCPGTCVAAPGKLQKIRLGPGASHCPTAGSVQDSPDPTRVLVSEDGRHPPLALPSHQTPSFWSPAESCRVTEPFRGGRRGSEYKHSPVLWPVQVSLACWAPQGNSRTLAPHAQAPFWGGLLLCCPG